MRRGRFEREWGWWLQSTRRVKVALAFWWLVPAAFLALACWGTYESMVKLPRDYSLLEQRGVRAEATFAGCTGGRDTKCYVRSPEGRWTYRYNHSQFDGLVVGDSVEMVVDPRQPQRRYTVFDVEHKTNKGFGVLFVFSVLVGIAGLVGVPILLRFSQAMVREAQFRNACSR